MAIADDGVILGFLASLPVPKRQPNLQFAGARYPEVTDLRRLVVDRHDRLVEVMLERRTQTNEPARCATILPALWRLPRPLALIEVGASAGLTLLVDRYSYDYDGTMVTGADPQAPTLSCHLEGSIVLRGPQATLQARHPAARRAGKAAYWTCSLSHRPIVVI